jgi:hypothetical protein
LAPNGFPHLKLCNLRSKVILKIFVKSIMKALTIIYNDSCYLHILLFFCFKILCLIFLMSFPYDGLLFFVQTADPMIKIERFPSEFH